MSKEKYVYYLEHSTYSFKTGEEHDDSFKALGIYASYELAEEAIKRYQERPGFKEYPDGYHIDRYQVNEDNWVEGFSVIGVYVETQVTGEYSKVICLIPDYGEEGYEIRELTEPEKDLVFSVNDIVKCEYKILNDDKVLVAVEKLNT